MWALISALVRKKYVSDRDGFPFYWIMPGELLFRADGMEPAKGYCWSWLVVRAFWRRSVRKLPPLFWM